MILNVLVLVLVFHYGSLYEDELVLSEQGGDALVGPFGLLLWTVLGFSLGLAYFLPCTWSHLLFSCFTLIVLATFESNDFGFRSVIESSSTLQGDVVAVWLSLLAIDVICQAGFLISRWPEDKREQAKSSKTRKTKVARRDFFRGAKL